MTNNILERLRGRYIICHAMSWAPFAYFFVVPSLPRTKKYEKGAGKEDKKMPLRPYAHFPFSCRLFPALNVPRPLGITKKPPLSP